VQSHTLPAIQLQRYALVFQNVLASYHYVMVEEATQISLNCYESPLWTTKQLPIILSVAGRSSWLTYAQQE
jgi:hypothetical protein